MSMKDQRTSFNLVLQLWPGDPSSSATAGTVLRILRIHKSLHPLEAKDHLAKLEALRRSVHVEHA
jgi:hypothetical protein